MEKTFINSDTYRFLYDNREHSARYPTFVETLRLLFDRGGHTIVETGIVRQPEDWGGGMSTVIFGKYCEEFGCRLFTIDNDPRHMAIGKSITKEWAAFTEYILSDSIKALREFDGQIDLLYLDSVDYPIDWILDLYGRDDPDASIRRAQQLTEDEIIRQFGDLIEPCQEHQLQEIQEAEDKLADGSLVLLDDALMPGGGKVRLAKKYLLENGWEVVQEGQQVLLSK